MHKHRILYVEDEPLLGKVVRESLESRGFEVRMLGDGRNLLPEIEAFQPEAVILDVMLPYKDGFSLGKEVRKQHSDLPILFLTAKTTTADVLDGFSAGGNDYLKKPFSMEELIARIRNLIQMTSSEDSTRDSKVYSLGQYEYRPSAMVLVKRDQELRLSHKENELLKFLNARRSEVVERQAILQAIWGNDSFFNSRNLDVYVTKLRRHFKDEPAVEIVTLKGVGYRFLVEEGRR